MGQTQSTFKTIALIGGAGNTWVPYRVAASAPRQKLVNCKTDVGSDPSQQGRRDIAAAVIWNCSTTPLLVAKLLVRTSLPYFGKPKALEDCNDLISLQDRRTTHGLGNCNRLQADELAFNRWIAVFQQHRHHLTQIMLQFVERRCLSVRTREPRNVAHEQAGVFAALHNCRVCTHIDNAHDLPSIAYSRKAHGHKVHSEAVPGNPLKLFGRYRNISRWTVALDGTQPFNQSSTRSPLTRLNSRTLCVTSTASSDNAWAAISMSSGPIGKPRRIKSARTKP